MNKEVQVGVGVIVFRNNRILLGERMGSHGAGTWGLPGGHLDFGECIEECAKREVLEETGLTLASTQQFAFTNDIFEEEGKHYITLFVTAPCCDGETEILEPLKCKQWKWFEPNNLPKPLFLSLANLLKDGPGFNTIEGFE